MSDAGNKQIKLSVALDTGSFNSAKKALQELTRLASEFARTLNGASIGNLFGGASNRALGSGLPGITTPGPGAPRGASAGSGGGGGGSPLMAAVQANKSLLQSTASDSKAAFRIMTDGVRSAIRDQSTEIDRLQNKLKSLHATYEQVQKAAKAGGWNASRTELAREIQAETHSAMGALGGARETMADLERAEPNQFSGIFGRGRAARRRLKLALQGGGDDEFMEHAGTLTGGGGGLRGMLGKMGYTGSGVPSGMGFLGGARSLLGQAGPGLAIAGAYEFLNQTQMKRDASVADYTLWNGMQRQQRAAGVNQAYGGLGMAMKSDVNMALAAGSLTPTDISGAIGREQMSALLTKAYQKANATGSLGDVKEQAQDWVGRVMDASEEHLSAGDMSIRQMALDQATSNMGKDAADRLREQVQNKYGAQNLQDQSDRSYFQQNYNARMGQQRAYGSSKMRTTGYKVANSGDPGAVFDHTGIYGHKGEFVLPTQVSAAETAGVNTNYQPGEIGGMMASLRGQVGGAFAGEGMAKTMLNFQQHGFNGAPILAGAQGYGNPVGVMNSISAASSVNGGGGLWSAAAANQAAGVVVGGMQSGDMFTSGQGFSEGLMAVGGAMGGDLRAARATEAGYGALSNYMGGGIDKLQRGINVLASVGAAPGSLYAQEALRDMTPAQRADILRKAKSDEDIPEEWRLQGVTLNNMKAYGGGQDKYLFSRFQSKQADPEVAAQVASFRENGGFSSLDGLHGKPLISAFTKLAVAGRHSGLGNTVDAAKSMLMQRAAMENPALFKALKAGGLNYDSSGGKEAEMKANEDIEKQRLEDNLKEHGQAGETVAGTGKSAQTQAQNMIKLGQDFNVATTSVSKALTQLAKDINEARKNIRTGPKGDK